MKMTYQAPDIKLIQYDVDGRIMNGYDKGDGISGPDDWFGLVPEDSEEIKMP